MKIWIYSREIPSTFKVEQVGFNTYANGMTLRGGGGGGFSPDSRKSLQVLDESKLEEIEAAYRAEGISYSKEKSLF